MTGASFTKEEARVRIDAHKDDIVRLTTRAESPEDEEHARAAREGVSNAYRRMALFAAFVGDGEEAERSLRKATEWYRDHLDELEASADLALRGEDGARLLVDFMEVAVLTGDEELRAAASQRCLSTTVEDAGDHEGLGALSDLLAALVDGGDVGERLEALEVDDADVPAYVSSAIEAIRGIHEDRAEPVVRGIEGVLAAHAEGEGPRPYDPLSLDAFALYVLARERSLVSEDDITTDGATLPDYDPGGSDGSGTESTAA